MTLQVYNISPTVCHGAPIDKDSKWGSVINHPKNTFEIDLRNKSVKSCWNEINGNTYVLSMLRIRY